LFRLLRSPKSHLGLTNRRSLARRLNAQPVEFDDRLGGVGDADEQPVEFDDDNHQMKIAGDGQLPGPCGSAAQRLSARDEGVWRTFELPIPRWRSS
jgi:hypothetical protein